MPARRLLINGVMRIDPRQTRAWRRLRAQVIREEPTCRLRFPGICSVTSTTADHIVPVEQAPELALVRTNCRGSCRPCNKARGTVPDEAIDHDADRSPALDVFG